MSSGSKQLRNFIQIMIDYKLNTFQIYLCLLIWYSSYPLAYNSSESYIYFFRNVLPFLHKGQKDMLMCDSYTIYSVHAFTSLRLKTIAYFLHIRLLLSLFKNIIKACNYHAVKLLRNTLYLSALPIINKETWKPMNKMENAWLWYINAVKDKIRTLGVVA